MSTNIDHTASWILSKTAIFDSQPQGVAQAPALTARLPHFSPPLLKSSYSPPCFLGFLHHLFPWSTLFSRSILRTRSVTFDYDGDEHYPECYNRHAHTVPLHDPLLSPDRVVEIFNTTESIKPKLGVVRADERLVIKHDVTPRSIVVEALNLLMIRTMTSIPVPKVHQVVFGGDEDGEYPSAYLVMEHIEGQTLDDCWSDLGFLAKLRIAWTLRGYVSQLRRLRRSVPGTINGTQCEGHCFGEYGTAPFASYDDMTAWFNHKLDVAQRMKKAPLDAPRFDNRWPLVFTHQDLCPRNIILSTDGTLYVIDWEWSGFYPAWFEYAGMVCDRVPTPKSWKILIPFITGFQSKRMIQHLHNVSWAVLVGFMM